MAKATTTNVNFEDDIPSISRQGGSRSSKYDTLLDKTKERAQKVKSKKVAFLTFESQGQATSRYTSIKSAVDKREDAAHWQIAVRNVETDDGTEVRLYIKWNDEPVTEDA